MDGPQGQNGGYYHDLCGQLDCKYSLREVDYRTEFDCVEPSYSLSKSRHLSFLYSSSLDGCECDCISCTENLF